VLLQDIRFGLRTALKNKAVTAVAIVCLGVGIGVNTMMFSVTDGVLIQPLPYANPDRLIMLSTTHQRGGVFRDQLSWLDLQDWQDRARSFSALAGVQWRSFTIGDSREPERYQGAAVSYTLFSLLGKSPQLGRNFSAEDDRVGAEPVVIISDDLWRRRYAGDPSIVGRGIQVNGRPRTVIGIMPPRFNFPNRQYLWVPLADFAVRPFRGARGLQVFGRLQDGVTLEQARREADAVAANLAAAYPDTNDGWGANVRPIREWAIPRDIRDILLTMMGAVTLVLLIACFNVANLMLARASTRAREMSIRTALGAGRGRIVRQLLAESILIGLFSVPLGVACAWGGIALVDASIPVDSVPYYIHWELNTRALLYAIGVAVATGVVFGLAPALQASKPDLQETLKESGRGMAGAGRVWLRNGLVVAEVALSLLLLIGASLFVRSFINLRQANGGFDTAPLMTMRLYMPNEQYVTAQAKTLRVQDIVHRIESLPGVQAAFASNMVPLGSGGGASQIRLEDRTFRKGDEPQIQFVGITPHMLRALGLSVVRGRDLTETEGETLSTVALVNQAMVARFWPNQDPIGRRFHALDDETGGWFTVVGVVPDFRHTPLDDNEAQPAAAYVSYQYGATPNTGITIRAAGDPALLSAPAREQIRLSDRSIPVFDVFTMEALRQRGYWQYFLFGWMFSLFGGIALLLAAIGVYGVLSYAVAQRTQEIGVRVALGAARGDVLRLVLVQGARLALAGVLFGAAASFMVTPVVRRQLYHVSPADPFSFIAVSLFLTAVALFASYMPARRAMAVDPLVALRTE
jgi:putative ABC transport system permease protein